jgi:hypothetical protein
MTASSLHSELELCCPSLVFSTLTLNPELARNKDFMGYGTVDEDSDDWASTPVLTKVSKTTNKTIRTKVAVPTGEAVTEKRAPGRKSKAAAKENVAEQAKSTQTPASDLTAVNESIKEQTDKEMSGSKDSMAVKENRDEQTRSKETLGSKDLMTAKETNVKGTTTGEDHGNDSRVKRTRLGNESTSAMVAPKEANEDSRMVSFVSAR